MSLYLKGLQSCRLSNFFHFSKITCFSLYIILLYENSATYEHFWFFQVLKLWLPVTLQPLEVQGHIVPFWKPPINVSLDPGCQGCCTLQMSTKACWKMMFYYIGYYIRKITNANDCNTYGVRNHFVPNSTNSKLISL